MKDKKNYKCSFCGKYFTRSQYLMIHINNVHEGHKDHEFNEKDETINNVNEGTKNIESNIARLELRKFSLELQEFLVLND